MPDGKTMLTWLFDHCQKWLLRDMSLWIQFDNYHRCFTHSIWQVQFLTICSFPCAFITTSLLRSSQLCSLAPHLTPQHHYQHASITPPIYRTLSYRNPTVLTCSSSSPFDRSALPNSTSNTPRTPTIINFISLIDLYNRAPVALQKLPRTPNKSLLLPSLNFIEGTR